LTQVDKTYRARYLRNAYLESLRVIEPVIKNHNLTLVETALRWLVHHSSLKMGEAGNELVTPPYYFQLLLITLNPAVGFLLERVV
jgi:hypothetical protein